jgi:hypothetical protein
MRQRILVDKLRVMPKFMMERIVLVYVRCVVLVTGEFWCLCHGL